MPRPVVRTWNLHLGSLLTTSPSRSRSRSRTRCRNHDGDYCPITPATLRSSHPNNWHGSTCHYCTSWSGCSRSRATLLSWSSVRPHGLRTRYYSSASAHAQPRRSGNFPSSSSHWPHARRSRHRVRWSTATGHEFRAKNDANSCGWNRLLRGRMGCSLGRACTTRRAFTTRCHLGRSFYSRGHAR